MPEPSTYLSHRDAPSVRLQRHFGDGSFAEPQASLVDALQGCVSLHHLVEPIFHGQRNTGSGGFQTTFHFHNNGKFHDHTIRIKRVWLRFERQSDSNPAADSLLEPRIERVQAGLNCRGWLFDLDDFLGSSLHDARRLGDLAEDQGEECSHSEGRSPTLLLPVYKSLEGWSGGICGFPTSFGVSYSLTVQWDPSAAPPTWPRLVVETEYCPASIRSGRLNSKFGMLHHEGGFPRYAPPGTPPDALYPKEPTTRHRVFLDRNGPLQRIAFTLRRKDGRDPLRVARAALLWIDERTLEPRRTLFEMSELELLEHMARNFCVPKEPVYCFFCGVSFVDLSRFELVALQVTTANPQTDPELEVDTRTWNLFRIKQGRGLHVYCN